MIDIPTLRVAELLKSSSIYGPGDRFVIWLQGCTLRCPGCWNQEMWSAEGGQDWRINDLAQLVLSAKGSDGVTLMGGEPLGQAEALVHFLDLIRAAGKSVVLFTGYESDELTKAAKQCFKRSDIVVTGRYLAEMRDTSSGWRGSANQRIHFPTGRYGSFGSETREPTEISVGEDGQISVAGYPDEELIALLKSL